MRRNEHDHCGTPYLFLEMEKSLKEDFSEIEKKVEELVHLVSLMNKTVKDMNDFTSEIIKMVKNIKKSRKLNEKI